MAAAPLNIKPPPINKTEPYILRLVSSVAVNDKALQLIYTDDQFRIRVISCDGLSLLSSERETRVLTIC